MTSRPRPPLSSPASSNALPADSAVGCLLRSLWLFVGNVALVFAAVFIVKQRQGLGLTWTDGLYWGIAVVPFLARYLDIRYFNGTTADGDPSTMRDWSRYAAILVGAALALWLAAHGVAHVTAT